MIQAINPVKQVSFTSTPACSKTAHSNIQLQTNVPYSKEYSNASKSITFASINMNKLQNVSFSGQKMQQLPEGWIFDLVNMRIRDNYGVENKNLTEDQKKEITEESNFDLKLFASNRSAKVPFYKYTPICKTSSWMPDGYVDVKKFDDLEFVCWDELKQQFND